MESTSIFFPDKNMLGTPREVGLDYEDVNFKTADNIELHGWLIRSYKTLAIQNSTPTIIFAHGNAGNISGRLGKLSLLNQLGVNIFIFDYRGYGKSQGSPSERGMYIDAQAAYDYLMTRSDIDHKKIIIYGTSLGGAAAVDLAYNRDCACLILESTFTSAADMAKHIIPFVPTFLLSTKLDSINKIKKIAVPKLFIHSPEDETIPYAFGKKLYDTAPSPKKFVEIKGSHNEGFFESKKIIFDSIKLFLEENNMISK